MDVVEAEDGHIKNNVLRTILGRMGAKRSETGVKELDFVLEQGWMNAERRERE